LGLSKSYGSSLGNGYNSYSSGYSPGGYSSYLSRANGYYSSSQATPDVYKKSYTNDNVYPSNSNGSRRNYYRSKTESSFSSVLDNIKTSLTSWRSKSTDGYSRDSRSMSRDLYNNNNRETSFDSFREPSLARDMSRDFSSYRSFTPSRDFTPSREFTPSSRRGSVAQEPLPPSRMRKFALHKSTSNLYDADESVSRNSLVRSSSYHDLQDSKKLQQQTRNSSFFGGNNSSNDLTRTRSIADLYSPRNEGWRGSGLEINGNNNSDRSTRPWRLSSMISLSGSFSDLGYQSQSSSRRESLANVPSVVSGASQELKKSNLKSQNGEIDYKKLWEESQSENSRLRTEMSSIRTDLDSTRQQLEAAIQASTKNSISDSEKREKKMLERKLSEMEEELKQLQKLKTENEKLKSENRALTRVVSKLTAAASGVKAHSQDSRAT